MKYTEKDTTNKASFHLLAYFLQQADDITMLCVSVSESKASFHLLAYFLQEADDITMLCVSESKASFHLLAYFLQQANGITIFSVSCASVLPLQLLYKFTSFHEIQSSTLA